MNRHSAATVAILAGAVGAVGAGACIDRHGGAPPAPHALGASHASTAPPSSWTVPVWYIDPSGTVTGPLADGGTGPCASDSNSCTSATCGAAGSGIGPCLTWREVNARLGCSGAVACPHWRQATTIAFLSSQTDATDTIYLRPALEASGNVSIVGTPTTVCSGTLSGVAARNRSSGTLPQATLCSGAAADTFVANTTRGGGAWIKALVSGSTWSLSEPMATPIPWNCTDPGEQDTWANGDAYAVETLPTVYLVDIEPTSTGTAQCWGAQVSHVTVPAGAPLLLGGGAALTEALVRASAAVTVGTQALPGPTGLDVDFRASFAAPATSSFLGAPSAKGGILNVSYQTGTGLVLEGSVVVTGGNGLQEIGGQLNDVFVDSGQFLYVSGYAFAQAYPGQSGPFVWGPGSLSILTTGTLNISSGTAAAALLVTTTGLGGHSTGCYASNAASPAMTCGVSVTGANVDAHGSLFTPLGASIFVSGNPF